MALGPAQPPQLSIRRRWIPAPSPSPAAQSPSPSPSSSPSSVFIPSSTLPIYFSPPLIAMVVIAAAAFLIITYSRLISHRILPPLLRLFGRYKRWRRRRRLIHRRPSSLSRSQSPPYYFDTGSDGYGGPYSPYGLDESTIRAMPLSIYSEKSRLIEEFSCDCAVCLLEFEENDYVRTLPHCCHSFHVDCIDAWLRCHATCPLCRAGILPVDSSPPPFAPLMAARIRPSLDEGLLLDSIFLDTLPESPPSLSSDHIPPPGRRRSASMEEDHTEIEIEIEEGTSATPRRDHHHSRSDMVLKRSYSFGFERSFASSSSAGAMMMMEPATASPSWRFQHHRHHQQQQQQHRRGGSSFWRRPSPLGNKSRVFSFRSYRAGGLKSPFLLSSRRRGFVPLSESAGMRYSSSYYYYYYHYQYHGSESGGGGSSSSRRSKSFASPMFGRSGAAAAVSSRMRCGDPEALLSPERFGRG